MSADEIDKPDDDGSRAATEVASGQLGGREPLGPGWQRNGKPPSRPVFVDLDVLFAALTPTAASVPSAERDSFVGQGVVAPPVRRPGRVVCSGEVPGQLYGWERADDDGRAGPWVAVVSFAMPYRDDVRLRRRMDLVAVPASAVRPADRDSAPPRLPPSARPAWRRDHPGPQEASSS